MRALGLIALVVLIPACVQAQGADAKLEALRQLLVPLRGSNPTAQQNARGASPVFQLAKHELRDWIESRLPVQGVALNPAALSRELNARLKARKLVLEDSGRDTPAAGGGPSQPGYVGEVNLTLTNGFVAVQTQLGLWCGLDESAYLFEWRDGRWRLRWESEVNDYSKTRYDPLHWQHILVSPPNPENNYLILAVGSTCMSNWSGGLIYRLWRMRPDSPPKLLLDYKESEIVYSDGDSQVQLGSSDFLIQFRVGSIDSVVHNHAAVRHYRVEGDGVQQVDPFVLIPRDFVDTWVNDPWSVSAGRSESAGLKHLEEVHRKFNRNARNGEFGQLRGPSLDYLKRCTDDRDVWQVRLFTSDGRGGLDALYFLVRWQQPYHFMMVDVRGVSSPACSVVDPDGEKERSVFGEAK